MKFDRVTMTGADDSVFPIALRDLSKTYPYVEWGILVSASQEGSYRFPGRVWIDHLLTLAAVYDMHLSMHLCGRWLRDLLKGDLTIPLALLHPAFHRIQLNFHGEELEFHPALFHSCLRLINKHMGRSTQFIFQIDGRDGMRFLSEVLSINDSLPPDGRIDAVPLFDVSHGAGVLPEAWPNAIGADRVAYFGYAGGLGPDNLDDQLPLIAAAAGDARVWVDMETKVRSSNDAQFDLAKVEQCLISGGAFMVWDAQQKAQATA